MRLASTIAVLGVLLAATPAAAAVPQFKGSRFANAHDRRCLTAELNGNGRPSGRVLVDTCTTSSVPMNQYWYKGSKGQLHNQVDHRCAERVVQGTETTLEIRDCVADSADQKWKQDWVKLETPDGTLCLEPLSAESTVPVVRPCDGRTQQKWEVRY